MIVIRKQLLKEIEEFLNEISDKPEPDPAAWLWQSDNNIDQSVFMRKFEAEQMKFKHGGVIYPLVLDD